MIMFEGNNRFEDNRYDPDRDYRDWSAPVYETPEELLKALHDANLLNRRIKAMRPIKQIERVSQIDIYDVEKARSFAEMHANDEWGVEKSAEIAGPFVLEFEDGDKWEYEFGDESCFRFSVNCLPRSLRGSAEKEWTVDANVLFEEAIGGYLYNITVTGSLYRKNTDYPSRYHPLLLQDLYRDNTGFIAEDYVFFRQKQYSYIDRITLYIARSLHSDVVINICRKDNWIYDPYSWYMKMSEAAETMVLTLDQLKRLIAVNTHDEVKGENDA